MKQSFFLLCLLATLTAHAQQKDPVVSAGVEADVLPYITGGYYGSIWVAHSHFRYRAILTRVSTPDFLLENGFGDNRMTVYAVIADYFFKPAVDRWWVGTGFEYWDARIGSDLNRSTAAYHQYVFTAGGGYVWKFAGNFYLNPWAAVHLRMAGEKRVPVGDATFEPAFFTPEGSLKIGWYFNRKLQSR